MTRFETGEAPSTGSGDSAKARIFTACHGTQLLVIQHLRRHLDREPAREYLIWYPMDNSQKLDVLMTSIIAAAGFSGVLDMRNFKSLLPRRSNSVRWWFEAAWRCRLDAEFLRGWMRKCGIREMETELWSDDPLHWNVIFAKALLRKARQVKIPHAFNLEDGTCCEYRAGLLRKSLAASPAKRLLFWPWIRLASSCDFRSGTIFRYEVGYSFDRPGCWAKPTLDVGEMITARAFEETLETLPIEIRTEVHSSARQFDTCPRPLVLLLLFGLSADLASAYRESLSRIFAQRALSLRGCTLAIKVHPGSSGLEEGRFIAWAKANLAAEVVPIHTLVNLEFMLADLAPDFILAGPCGALPVARRLGVGVPIVLPEIMAELCRKFPGDTASFHEMVVGMETW